MGRVNIAPIGGSISVEPYSSTAMPLMWPATIADPGPPSELGLFPGKRRRIFEFGSRSSKAQRGALIMPGKRQT